MQTSFPDPSSRILWVRHAGGRVQIENTPGTGESVSILPFLSRAESRSGLDWQSASSSYRVLSDVQAISLTEPTSTEHKLGYLEAALTAGLAGEADGVPLGFRYETAECLAPELLPVLDHYGAAPVWAEGQERLHDVSLEVRIAAGDTAAWKQFPARRVDGAHDCHTAMARAVQLALRRWVRFVWLRDVRRFEDVRQSQGLMLYWVSNPFYAGNGSDFGYDPLSSDSMRRFYNASARRMRAELEYVSARLEAEGSGGMLPLYRKRDSAAIVKAVRREAKTVNRMLMLEWNVSKALAAFSRAAIETAVKDPLRHYADAAQELGTTLRSVLRRLPVADWQHDVALLLFAEATAALRQTIGLPGGLDFRCAFDEKKEAAQPLVE